METIKNYLENMFGHMPNTAEVKRAKEELLQMMEDKYLELKKEGKTENEAVGQVIAEFGNLDEVADQLGIARQVNAAGKTSHIVLTTPEVDSYLDDNRKSSSKIATGVAFCILSPTPLLVLKGLTNLGWLTDKAATALGIALLFIAIATGVYFFITSGIATEKYDDYEKLPIDLDPSDTHRVRQLKEFFRPEFGRMIAIGVVLILVGVVAITTMSILEVKPEFWIMLAVVFMLCMVATAVYLFITAGSRQESYDILLNEGDFSRRAKRSNTLMDVIAGPYWMIVAAVYLTWSFISQSWGISWIVFPIAGIIFGMISAILQAIESRKED